MVVILEYRRMRPLPPLSVLQLHQPISITEMLARSPRGVRAYVWLCMGTCMFLSWQHNLHKGSYISHGEGLFSWELAWDEICNYMYSRA